MPSAPGRRSLLYTYDFWAVVRGSEHTAMAMRLIQSLTDEAPLLALSAAWPVNPVTASVARNPALRAANPLMMSNHVDGALRIDTEFWLEHGTDLEQRFTAWLNR